MLWEFSLASQTEEGRFLPALGKEGNLGVTGGSKDRKETADHRSHWSPPRSTVETGGVRGAGQVPDGRKVKRLCCILALAHSQCGQRRWK